VDQLHDLCERADSVLAQVARAQLEGLRVTLQALLEASPDDPGAAACAGALGELAALTARPGPAARSAAIQVPVAGRAERSASGPADAAAAAAHAQLADLAAALADSKEATDYLGSPRVPADSAPGTLWDWYHLMLLRLPTARARQWEARALKLDIARQDEQTAAAEQWEEWPLLPQAAEASVLIPALPALGVTGIRLAAAGAPDDWACKAAGLDVPGKAPSPLAAQGAVLGTWIAHLAARDPLLSHVLENLTVSGLRPLAEPRERRAYLDELARRLARAAEQTAAPADRLRAALALDEALCSVIHVPPAADKSWFGAIGRMSELLVLALSRDLREDGVDVRVDVPAVMYADARRQTRNDIPLGVGGEVGQVLAVLKLWSRIDGKEYRGRVVHRLETGRSVS
jgi:hypothetical protein